MQPDAAQPAAAQQGGHRVAALVHDGDQMARDPPGRADRDHGHGGQRRPPDRHRRRRLLDTGQTGVAMFPMPVVRFTAAMELLAVIGLIAPGITGIGVAVLSPPRLAAHSDRG